MDDAMTTVEAATQALAATAERAARLMRQETERAKEEAARARREIEVVKEDLAETREEISATRNEIQEVRREIRASIKGEDKRYEKSAKAAWSAVGVMALAVMIAIGWTAARLTRTDSELGHLNGKLSEYRSLSDQRSTELANLREQAETARIAAAKAQGQLQAYSEERLTSISDRPVPADETPAITAPVETRLSTPDAHPEPKIDLKPEPQPQAEPKPQASPAPAVDQEKTEPVIDGEPLVLPEDPQPAIEPAPATPAAPVAPAAPAIANQPLDDKPAVADTK